MLHFRQMDRTFSGVHLLLGPALDPVGPDLPGAVLIAQHHVLPDLLVVDEGELRRHEAVVLGRQRHGDCGRDDDVGAAGQELSIQVIQVVLEAGLHHGLVGLLGQDDCVFVVAIELYLVNFLDLIRRFQLV